MASLLAVFVAQKCEATDTIPHEHACTLDENFGAGGSGGALRRNLPPCLAK